MARYVIGDVQGCYADLQALLHACNFDSRHDELWFAGDLVSRGPDSLSVLRFVKGLGDRARVVLGNHDLHLLAVAETLHRSHARDGLRAVLEAPDSAELLDWLRHQPLLQHDADTGFTLVHAGLPPQWDLALAQSCAREVEDVLRGGDYHAYFHHMYGDTPHRWSEKLSDWERLRFITNCITRLRYCDREGNVDMKPKGAPGTQPAGLLPWFEVPGRASRGMKIVFGHWATLGWLEGNGVWGLDSGCVWGGALSALRLEDRRRFSVPCANYCQPGGSD